MKELANSILGSYNKTKGLYQHYIDMLEQAYSEMTALMYIATIMVGILIVLLIIVIKHKKLFKKTIKLEVFKFLQK